MNSILIGKPNGNFTESYLETFITPYNLFSIFQLKSNKKIVHFFFFLHLQTFWKEETCSLQDLSIISPNLQNMKAQCAQTSPFQCNFYPNTIPIILQINIQNSNLVDVLALSLSTMSQSPPFSFLVSFLLSHLLIN